MTTQWRAVLGLGGLVWMGLDYAAIPVVLGAPASPDLMRQIRIMEMAALAILNEARP